MRHLDALLDELVLTSSDARRRLVRDRLLDEARHALGPDRARIENTLRTVGFSRPLPEVVLAPGSAWLLVHRPGHGGSVGRVVAGGTRGWEASTAEVERAFRGLLAAIGRAMRRVAHARAPAVALELGEAEGDVEGSSLGLSVAVAIASALTGRAPHATCAASAQVLEDGSLRPVEHLVEKSRALREALGGRASLVVARRQHVPEEVERTVSVVRADRIDDALGTFGLDLGSLAACGYDEHLDRVDRARATGQHPHGADAWLARANELWESAAALAADAPSKALEGRVHAAHFALHAGRVDLAMAWLARDASSIRPGNPHLDVLVEIVAATTAIDAERFDEAVARSSRAVTLADALPHDLRAQFRGLALGTQGRAYLHGGDLAAAEPLLVAAVEHHDAEVPLEAPRSRCYLAACLRLAGRIEDARATIDAALGRIGGRAQPPRVFETTETYALLERGRILLAAGEPQLAVRDLEVVAARQEADAAYPRLGALRDLARAHRALGDRAGSDDALRRCVSVALAAAVGSTIARAAAMAAGFALAGGWDTHVAREQLEAAWSAAFGAPFAHDGPQRLARFVY